MDSRPYDKLRNTTSWWFCRMTISRFILASCIALVSSSGLMLASCQKNAGTNEQSNTALAPETDVPEETATQDNASETKPSTNQPKDTPKPSTETAIEAPNNPTLAQSGASLPDTLTRQWEPASNVLFTFGAMTITPDQVQWSSGQSSPYTVVSTDGGYLLQLESNPTFYETQNPYIKIIPKTDETGGITSVDVAFYESTAKAESDDYIMYGSYFVE